MIQIDMDMPKSCADCPCGNAQDGWCYVHNEVLEKMENGYPSTETRPDWCPLTDAVLHWIPCSERLPDKNGRYLVTVKQGYITFGTWVDVAENWAQVTAWMPLPRPYEVKE